MNIYNILSEHIEKTPDKAAVICDGETLTYKELAEEIDKLTKVLDSFGIKKGDKVNFLVHNTLFLVAAFFACFRIGAVAAPLSLFASEREIANANNNCKGKVFFCTSGLYHKLANIKENSKYIENIVITDKKPANGDLFLEDLYEKTKNRPSVKCEDLPPESEALMYHTSGSTGMPKGVTHTHKSLYASAKNRAETLNLTSSDIAFTSSYLAHAAASLVVLLPFLYAGGTSVYTNIHTIENYFDLIRKHKLTHFAVSPKDWKEMMETKEFSKDDFKYLKFAFSGGDVVPEKLQKTVLDKTGVPLSIGMGMTECGGYITTPPGMKFKFGSLGKPVKGVEIRLVDDEFKDVPAGETGEIVVKSDMVMAYYYNDEENTKKVFKDGWFLTGDLAFKDEEGYYFFRGRKKNIIVKDTGNINPVEVENSLLEHPGVASVIVMGVDDEESGQKIAACIISKDKNNPPSKKELQEFLKGKIADRKIPDYWLFLDDFPDKTSIKKVNIKQLREMINQKITGNAV